ncbi:MAG TPA: FAD-dependent oxidoreductase, partial [Luteimonas sp.]|nr:FAD-dependent oxidoreductase [Luteimonas sp.]
MAARARGEVLIAGAGVIGLCTGLALRAAGRPVRVLEAHTIGSGSSHGNCGTITPSHAAPLAAPGAVAQALRWMATPDAPFYVAPRLDPALWAWMLHFASRCNRHDWRTALAARAALLNASRRAMPEWMAQYELDCEFVETGVDYVFRTGAALRHFDAEVDALAAAGVVSERIDGADYLGQEPALRPGVVGAVRFPGDASLRPDVYVAGLARALRAAGGEIEEGCAVGAIEETATGVRVQSTCGVREGAELVVASGAWSPVLARATGLAKVPVQPGKGYSITYDRPALAPRRPVVLAERSVCVTAWPSGYRLGSTMELAGYDATLNRRRLDALERGAAEYLHDPVGPVKHEEWYGWRPLTWDDLPLIGQAAGARHVWLATGHGMLGMSMGIGT